MKAIFAGTFDPFTTGHRDIVLRAARTFGDVTVAVAENTGKNTAPIKDRVDIAEESVRDIAGATVTPFSGLLSDFVKAQGDCILVRGVRNTRDLEYERDHCRIYASLCGVDAALFCTTQGFEHVSSTAVRELAALGGALDGYVVRDAMQRVISVYGKNGLPTRSKK